jgi:hypothetical protein
MRNQFHTILCLFLLVIGVTSCKKNSDEGLSVTLDTPQVSGPLVTLKWSKVNSSSVYGYMLMRSVDSGASTASTYVNISKTKTEYVDTLPLSPNVRYTVVARTNGFSGNVISNVQVVSRTDMPFWSFRAKDAVYDYATHVVYVYSADGQIVAYNTQTKTTIASINTTASLGYCDLGTYNGVTELYVPRSDGWLFIYDAATLNQVDQINIGGGTLTGVNAVNGILYISSYGSSRLYSYSRATKTMISSIYSDGDIHLKALPGSSTEFVGTSSYSQVFYYKFSSAGTYVSSNSAYLTGGSYYLGALAAFPDGNHFIMSSQGSIYAKDLSYTSTLPYGNMQFNSYAFDAAGQYIYAGTYQRSVVAYNASNYQQVKGSPVQGIPIAMFADNGHLVCVTCSTGYYSYYTTGYTSVETVDQ